jgi:hypothetical protein
MSVWVLFLSPLSFLFASVFPCFIFYIYTPPADRPAVAKLDRMRRRKERSRERERERPKRSREDEGDEMERVWLLNPSQTLI